jgi:hypothetical protein
MPSGAASARRKRAADEGSASDSHGALCDTKGPPDKKKNKKKRQNRATIKGESSGSDCGKGDGRCLFDDLFSLDPETCQTSTKNAFVSVCRYVEYTYGRHFYESDIRVLRALCRDDRVEAKLVYVLGALAKDIPLYEAVIRAAVAAGAERAAVERLVEYRTVLCIAIRSLFELPTSEDNIYTILNRMVDACFLVWKSFDIDAMRAWIDRHTVAPVGMVVRQKHTSKKKRR